MAATTTTQVPLKELIKLCTENTGFYGKTFFPATFRQPSAPFHKEIDDLLDDRAHRHVAIEVFRGGAKTTKLRVYTSKRIALGISRTIMFVSETQSHSIESIAWVRDKVENNRKWTQTFQLSKGRKWTDEHITIIHGLLGIEINLLAVGITGQLRGVNIADWRPDLIIVDDPCNEENTNTEEQRRKISNLFFGALEKSLTPASEAPDAKMVLLQTVLNKQDLISQCHLDPQWASRSYSCFDDRGQSTWPDRYPTAVLMADKNAHISRNQLSLWLREMEGKVVDDESADFRVGWLRDWSTVPERMITVIGVDPVPPPSDREIAQGFHKKDYECLFVMGKDADSNYYALEYSFNRGHTPEWTSMEFFRLVDKWSPLVARVEGVAYQKTLKWLLEKEMQRRGRYVQLNAPTDKRRKRHRILQAYSGIASQGAFYINPAMTEFREQWSTHPYCDHDDILDAGAMALDELVDVDTSYLDLGDFEDEEFSTDNLIEDWQAAP